MFKTKTVCVWGGGGGDICKKAYRLKSGSLVTTKQKVQFITKTTLFKYRQFKTAFYFDGDRQ